ncbi:hypothetical protein ACU8KH_00898 [Lachancea thermotolerans]
MLSLTSTNDCASISLCALRKFYEFYKCICFLYSTLSFLKFYQRQQIQEHKTWTETIQRIQTFIVIRTCSCFSLVEHC